MSPTVNIRVPAVFCFENGRTTIEVNGQRLDMQKAETVEEFRMAFLGIAQGAIVTSSAQSAQKPSPSNVKGAADVMSAAFQHRESIRDESLAELKRAYEDARAILDESRRGN